MFDRQQRLSGGSHISDRNANAALVHDTRNRSSHTSRSSAGSFGALSSLYDGNTVPTTPASSGSRDTYPDFSREASLDEPAQPFVIGHSHWCFKCLKPKVITTCDGWKRHMKEHETGYCCMPDGPTEHTVGGTNCAFCGFQNPDESHCNTHKVFPCAKKTLDARSYTRKPHFIGHLMTHHNSNIAELAERWKITVNKKHFSCGFCVSLFNTLIEQLNHIDTFHYRNHQDVRDWDSDKVIRGLLLQPDVAKSWRHILASHTGLTESLLHWDASVTKELQCRLEMGDELPENLAEMAFKRSTYDLSHRRQIEAVDITEPSHHGDVTGPPHISMTQATAPMHFNLDQSSVANGGTVKVLATQTEQHGWPWGVSDNYSYTHHRFLPQSISDMPEVHTMAVTPHSQLNTHQTSMASGGFYWTQPDLSTPWTTSKAPDINSTNTSSVMLCGHWQSTPILSPTNSSSLASSHPKYPIRHDVGSARSRYANQIPATSSGQKMSPLKFNSGLVAQTGLVGQPRKQPSRSKLKDHYDINTEADTDLDFDILQRLMREEDSTRSEKRKR